MKTTLESYSRPEPPSAVSVVVTAVAGILIGMLLLGSLWTLFFWVIGMTS